MQVANFDNAATGGGTSPTVTAAEVAGLLGVRPATFMRKREKLQEIGFPRPLPLGNARTPVYSRSLVVAWINNNGQAPEPSEMVDPIAAARDALEQRIGGRAA